MKLIADSGSTKTTWCLLEGETIKTEITTCGLNPYFHNPESVEAVIRADLAPYLIESHIREIHFYGAGCSTDYNNRLIEDSLHQFYKNADIRVYHDILGAARALFGNHDGVACILGTGCNSCYYDGNKTFSPIDSLGYLFGDEGAGSYLGKLLLGAYLKKELPDELRQAFDKQYNFTLEDILNSLYNKPSPNRFLASFSYFISNHRNHPFVNQILQKSFRDFFQAHILKYENYETTSIGFIGSIAYRYLEELTEVALEFNVEISKVLTSPMEGLIGYHLKD